MKHLYWQTNSGDELILEDLDILQRITELDTPYFIVNKQERLLLLDHGTLSNGNGYGTLPCVGVLPAICLGQFGNREFQIDHGTKASYMAGAMAHGISSAEMVIALGANGYLGSFGSGGLSMVKIEAAISTIQKALPHGPYAFNLLHNPYDEDYEMALVDLYLKHRIRTVEAAAYIIPSTALAYYRIAGLYQGNDGRIGAKNKIIAKVSHPEVAAKFMRPISGKLINELVSAKKITAEQAKMAPLIPFADDITVEADSGGHTDNRSLVSLLPVVTAVRDRIQATLPYDRKVRVGAAGGIGTPHAALAAFDMGADYIVTGSINQSCIESGTSQLVRQLLSQAEIADVMMAPSADMFDMGAKVQVLKKGTLFPLIARKLYKLYEAYPSIDQLPREEKEKLEKKIFKKDMDTIWRETRAYFQDKNPRILQKAQESPKKKMALIFSWFLGKSSLWAISGDEKRLNVFQIWCGQAMGAFNAWVKGSSLENPQNRNVVQVADLILSGAGLLSRINLLKLLGLPIEKDILDNQLNSEFFLDTLLSG
jgi:PfaD family protein